MLFSPLALFCWRAVQLVGCKSHPASLCPSASRMVGGHGWWQLGVTLHHSFSPAPASSWLWDSAHSFVRNRTWVCPLVLETLWGFSVQGVNQEVGLIL